jgi:hypothetical protein
MPQLTLEYIASPTIAKFIRSDKFYALCCGARGSGKSTAGLMRTIIRANQLPPQYHPLRWAVVRDTRKNIGLTVARTIRKWCPEPYAKWRGKPEEPESCVIYIKGKPLVHFDFFGVNSPGDHDRFQSYEASGGIWLEEPCPLATNTEFVASGIAESVLASAQTSVRGGPNPSIQITMNPPSADHWTAQLFHLPGFEAAGDDEMEMPPEAIEQRKRIRESADVFMVPPSECAAEKETPGYTERNRQILLATGRTDLLARLVDGRIGYAQVGERVTPEFSSMHIVNGLTIIPRVPIILAFDFGLNATCIAAQITPQGYLHILRAWTRENAGMKQLLTTDVQPWLAQQPVESWWYCGGPEAREREQSDSEETALRMIVNTLGNASYRAGPVSWSARRDALRDALTRTPGGLTWIRVSQQGAALLIRALDGGWHYPTDSMGHIRNNGQPDKRSKWDHLGDAFSHLCAVLLKKTDNSSRSVQKQRPSLVRHNHTVYTGSTRTGV